MNYTTYLFENRDSILDRFFEIFQIQKPKRNAFALFSEDDYLWLLGTLQLFEIPCLNQYCCSPTVIKLHVLNTLIECSNNIQLVETVREHFDI